MNFDRELETALAAVHKAAELCRAVQSAMLGSSPDPNASLDKKGVSLDKKDNSPVTVADYGSQAVVCRLLRQAFPHDPIIAEEDSTALRKPEHAAVLEQVVRHVRQVWPETDASAICGWIDEGRTDRYSSRFWTLDPIDGTKGFLRGEQYAVALALIVEGRVTAAVLGCPNLPAQTGPHRTAGSAFGAILGQGAWEASLADGNRHAIRVSGHADATAARFCESVEAGHSKHDEAADVAKRLGIRAESRRLDSQAKYAVVARGEAEIYLRLPTRKDYREKIWDHAAGALVIEEAGGKVTDVDGKPLEFNQGRTLAANRGIVATNGKLHAAVLTALQQSRAEAGKSDG